MKRVRCPKCDNYITFDETKYTDGQSLVFQCPECNKQFGIRIGVSKLKATQKEETIDENANEKGCGSIVVIENRFHYKQVNFHAEKQDAHKHYSDGENYGYHYSFCSFAVQI